MTDPFENKFHIIETPEPDLSGIYDDKRFVVDPLEYWDEDPKGHRNALIDACGWIPLWVQQWLDRNHHTTNPPTNLKSYLEFQYKIPLHSRKDASIDLKGLLVSTYPEEADVFPYLMVDVKALRPFYMYRNAYVAIPYGQGHFITHMD